LYENNKKMYLILKDFGENKMYLIKDDPGISKTLRKTNGYKLRELEFMSLIRKHVKRGHVCFDIGANIGYLTLILAKLVGKNGLIYAVEPKTKNYKVLKKNIELNNYKNVITKKIAISDKVDMDKKTKFFVSGHSNLGSLSKNRASSGNIKMVNTQTVDNFLQDKELPDIYEFDVEGHEVNILNGMHKTAEKSKSGTKIFMEVHPHLYNKKLNMKKALINMVELGFYFRYVISAAIARPKLFAKKGYKPIKVYKSSGWYRGIYETIPANDAIYFCSKSHEEYIPRRDRTTKKIVRYIVLEKK